MLGSTENTLGRSGIVEALAQQWPNHKLLVWWEPEMHQNEKATDGAWNANESRDAWGTGLMGQSLFELESRRLCFG